RNTTTAGRWSNLAQPATMTGRIAADGNDITLKTSGVKKLTLWLGRNAQGQMMIDFDKPVTVRINLKNVWVNRLVKPSLDVLLEDLYRRGDRQQPFLAKLELKPCTPRAHAERGTRARCFFAGPTRSHRRTVLSAPADASRVPLSRKTTPSAQAVCPSRALRNAPVAGFHSRRLRSLLADARAAPPGWEARAGAGPLGPARAAAHFPSFA